MSGNWLAVDERNNSAKNGLSRLSSYKGFINKVLKYFNFIYQLLIFKSYIAL